MRELDYFKKLKRKEKTELVKSNTVWLYTRVSSKTQFERNGSIETQLEESKSFAEKNNLQIVKTFGGSYESAKGDFTRKEFKSLIEEVKRKRTKPYAILIYKINRFSRSGGSAIGLVDDLVQRQGVHLIETYSGKSTETERGRIEIYENLLKARVENIDRMEITIPGMTRFLKKGNRLGSSPRGYDHFGPRVVDYKFIHPVQKIVINDEGKLLKRAWEWKKQGMKDYQIIKELKFLGLEIKKQALSSMWRNPFYCGVLSHNFLDNNPIEGNWERMVSKKDFIRINEQLNNSSRSGYEQSKEPVGRPLQQDLYCGICETKMTGYVARKKYHYYKCQNSECNCKDLNAHTGARSLQRGLNDLFEEFLQSFSLKEEFVELFKKQMKETIMFLEDQNFGDLKIYSSEIKKLENKLIKISDKFIEDEISSIEYKTHKSRTEEKLFEMRQKQSELTRTISNLNIKLEKCTDFVQNISKIWGSGTLVQKQKLQKLMFPEGIMIDPVSRQYRTNKIQPLFSYIVDLTKATEGQKKDSPIKNTDESVLVAGTGLEPMTFGL